MGNKGSNPKQLIYKTDLALEVLLEDKQRREKQQAGDGVAANAEASAGSGSATAGNGEAKGREGGGGGDGTAAQPVAQATETVCQCIELLRWEQRGRPISTAKKNERPATLDQAKTVAKLMTKGSVGESSAHPIKPGWIVRLLRVMSGLTIEAKKSLIELVSYLVREVAEFQEFVRAESEFVDILLESMRDTNYDATGVCIHAAKMLHVIVRIISQVADRILNEHVWEFLESHATVQTFDIQTLAFDIIRDCIFETRVQDGVEQTGLKASAAAFINGLWSPTLNPDPQTVDGIERSNRFFDTLNELTKKRDILVVQNAVRLLQDVLFDTRKQTYQSMIQYVGDVMNLRIALFLLRDTSTKIQYEGFHLFRVFVLNPYQPNSVKAPLARNKDKMISYLTHFQPEEAEKNEQFQRELTMTIEALSRLGDPSEYTTAKPAAAPAAEEQPGAADPGGDKSAPSTEAGAAAPAEK